MDILDYGSDGNLVVSEDAVSSIAISAAKDIEGVVGFSNKATDVVNTIRNGSLKVAAPVRVTNDGDAIAINMYINVLPGKEIQPIATGVQKAVKEAVQNMTGKQVSKVNVIVVSIENKENEEGAEE